MNRLWTGIKVSGRLMVSDFTNLHCEGSFDVEVDADSIQPGYVVEGIASYSYGVKVVSTSAGWVLFDVGGKSVLVFSGSTENGPDYPLSYAYGTISITLVGERLPAFALYEETIKSKLDVEKCMQHYDALLSLAENGDAWAAYLAASAFSQVYYKMDVDKLSATTRMLTELLVKDLATTRDLAPVEEKVWRNVKIFSSDYAYGALNMRVAVESFLNGNARGWDAAFNAMIAASYAGDNGLVEVVKPYLNPRKEDIVKVMELRYRQLHGLPYLDELKQLMDQGIWQAHFMYVLTFMPSPLALCHEPRSEEQELQMLDSVTFLKDYYYAHDYEFSSCVDGLHLANFCLYCIDKKRVSQQDLEKMNKGCYRGLAFCPSLYGLICVDSATTPKEMRSALDNLAKGATRPFLWPKQAYLYALDKVKTHDFATAQASVHQRDRLLLSLAISSLTK